MKGEFTPQGLFDKDPKDFMEKYMDSNEFVYMGLEHKALRRGDNKNWYYKVLVKEKLLKENIEKYCDQDPNYVPTPGRVLTYAQFFGFVCKSNNLKKKSIEIEKEKKHLARKYSIGELVEMEKKAIFLMEEECDREMVDLLKRRTDTECQINKNCVSPEDYNSFRSVRDMIDLKFSETNTKRMTMKVELTNYYGDIKKMREEIEIEKAAAQVERNNKRRLKRFDEKQARLRVDNGLTEISSDNVKTATVGPGFNPVDNNNVEISNISDENSVVQSLEIVLEEIVDEVEKNEVNI